MWSLHYYQMYWSAKITMTSHVRHVVSNHQSFDCLFNTLCGASSKKHQSPHYCPFVREIHRWPVNSQNKGTVTRKNLSFDDVIMNLVKVCFSNITLTVSTFSLCTLLIHKAGTGEIVFHYPVIVYGIHNFPCMQYSKIRNSVEYLNWNSTVALCFQSMLCWSMHVRIIWCLVHHSMRSCKFDPYLSWLRCVIEAELHICVSKLTIIGSDNGLSPIRCQAII